MKQNDMTSNGAALEMTSPFPPVTPESGGLAAGMSPQSVVGKGRRHGQRQLGPAPFASFEDLSDELDSPPETARVPLPGIREDPCSQLQSPITPLPQTMDIGAAEKEDQRFRESLASSLDAPAPPRIDISRASSSSQHEDSITSSPERENGTHNLGYREDGTVDLRSSTEELDYVQEPGTVQESEEKRKREKMMKRQQQVRDFGETQSQCDFVERKDSSCSVMSEAGLLCISGRTSRLSSIGSAASGGSMASGTSHLSAGSHQSGRSTRSPSPHKMLLETSFCGSKPVQSQSGETEPPSLPLTAAQPEKPVSRPPSRLRSRSPSPHKMLLETSFCGTKILPTATDTNNELPKMPKGDKTTTTTSSKFIVDAEPPHEKARETPPERRSGTAGREKRGTQINKLKPPRADQGKKNENKAAPLAKAKLVDLSKKSVAKPKKIISIRDLPGDEIYIPLKGPELDFEEMIRNASPGARKKIEKPESADEIFIPLHSPPKSSAEKEESGAPISRREPPHALAKCSEAGRGGGPSSQKAGVAGIGSASGGKRRAEGLDPKRRDYEVCEDGSIFIPLHSPDDDTRRGNNFENEIRRVDQELRRVREAAERRPKEAEEEEGQRKPPTLDLSDSGSHKSRLSQTCPSGKSEISSGGSRTPSPGSTLSRKSSFASLFRKSDVFSSPDSQSSTVRKKSGTLSNILKEASDGLRERSRSRSKSKDHQSQSSAAARSPSGKKNVFSSLFAKKRADVKVEAGEENEPSRLDLVFTFPAGAESNKAFDEGDYVIIPLRDPSDPPDSLDVEFRGGLGEVSENPVERPSSPLIILEKRESPGDTVFPGNDAEAVKSRKYPGEGSTPSSRKTETETAEASRLTTVERVRSGNWSPEGAPAASPEEDERRTEACEEQDLGDEAMKQRTARGICSKEPIESKCDRNSYFGDEKTGKKGSYEGESGVDDDRLRRDSSLEIDEKSSKEEILTVTDGGIRKLKLPPEPGDLEDDHERKGLVYQESFEDELPYVPTTLPLERPIGVRIVPVKHRVNEIKTCSIERPRSATPINPATLEDFVSSRDTAPVSVEEKMKISLPRDVSVASKSKSPTRHGGKGRTWFEFAEAVLQSPRDGRKSSLGTTPSPPPLPPRSSPPSVLSSSAPSTTSSWINFEELPEKRKLPKRITTVPALRSSAEGGEKSGASVGGGVLYSYVSPEDCQCECHDHNTSHGKEADHERGQEGDLTVEAKSDGEAAEKGRASESGPGEPRKLDATTRCRYCERGIHAAAERDIEERPLLDVDSDEEDSDFLQGSASPPKKVGGDHDDDCLSLSSNSSGECGSEESPSQVEISYEPGEARPFGTDLEVDSSSHQLPPSSPESLQRDLEEACSSADYAVSDPQR